MRLERDGECITVSPRVLKSVVGRKEILLMLNLNRKNQESMILGEARLVLMTYFRKDSIVIILIIIILFK